MPDVDLAAARREPRSPRPRRRSDSRRSSRGRRAAARREERLDRGGAALGRGQQLAVGAGVAHAAQARQARAGGAGDPSTAGAPPRGGEVGPAHERSAAGGPKCTGIHAARRAREHTGESELDRRRRRDPIGQRAGARDRIGAAGRDADDGGDRSRGGRRTRSRSAGKSAMRRPGHGSERPNPRAAESDVADAELGEQRLERRGGSELDGRADRPVQVDERGTPSPGPARRPGDPAAVAEESASLRGWRSRGAIGDGESACNSRLSATGRRGVAIAVSARAAPACPRAPRRERAGWRSSIGACAVSGTIATANVRPRVADHRDAPDAEMTGSSRPTRPSGQRTAAERPGADRRQPRSPGRGRCASLPAELARIARASSVGTRAPSRATPASASRRAPVGRPASGLASLRAQRRRRAPRPCPAAPRPGAAATGEAGRRDEDEARAPLGTARRQQDRDPAAHRVPDEAGPGRHPASCSPDARRSATSAKREPAPPRRAHAP